MQDCREQEQRVPSLPSIKRNVLRDSLSEDSQNIYSLRNSKEKGVVGNLYISWITFCYLELPKLLCPFLSQTQRKLIPNKEIALIRFQNPITMIKRFTKK